MNPLQRRYDECRKRAGVRCALTSHVLIPGGVLSMVCTSAFCVPFFRHFCVRYYDQCCAAWVVSILVLEMVSLSIQFPVLCVLLCRCSRRRVRQILLQHKCFFLSHRENKYLLFCAESRCTMSFWISAFSIPEGLVQGGSSTRISHLAT